MAVTIGANLTPVNTPLAQRISKAMRDLQRLCHSMLGQVFVPATSGAAKMTKVFTKAGAPAANTAADSPGSDLCFVIDTTNSDVYFINTWVSTTSFAATKVVD